MLFKDLKIDRGNYDITQCKIHAHYVLGRKSSLHLSDMGTLIIPVIPPCNSYPFSEQLVCYFCDKKKYPVDAKSRNSLPQRSNIENKKKNFHASLQDFEFFNFGPGFVGWEKFCFIKENMFSNGDVHFGRW